MREFKHNILGNNEIEGMTFGLEDIRKNADPCFISHGGLIAYYPKDMDL